MALKIIYILAFVRQHDDDEDDDSGEDNFCVHLYRNTMIPRPSPRRGGLGVTDANHVTDEDPDTGRSTSMHEEEDDGKIIVEIWEGK